MILALVDDMAARATKHDVSGIMEYVTNDYRAAPGSRDEQSVRAILVLALRRYGKFQIKYPVPGVTLGDDNQTATVSVPFLIVREGQKFPDAELAKIADDPIAWTASVAATIGDPYQLDLKLRKDADGWKVRQSDIAGLKSVGDL